mmetsp:Transcript_17314/g.16657  ORF Transcript_17314/g.16657 Transcript_17314/m.16657 type:complete len:116 (-) Transcript_17314:413-760(-)|eukprot:CAMPEP_0119034924 /NCGR_PEP_ID=MMETSP1177-20130426/1937_1 /TAXON_ID=2985 /ORGANISM="Ochromonas sp, Strain CCMP1899" /LENGTH=115 /DNA_ID=CAMNT_0006992749 /DNA_START=87 /DNA_END=434 /DNA_ORIENTATION=+
MGGKYQASKIQVAAKDPNVVSSHQKKKAKKAQKTLAQSEENHNIEQKLLESTSLRGGSSDMAKRLSEGSPSKSRRSPMKSSKKPLIIAFSREIFVKPPRRTVLQTVYHIVTRSLG